jgi:glycosyltransferase involved in cell wall biosynthesis
VKDVRSVAIGLIGPLPPPSGGMANQTVQLARLLEQAGLRVRVVRVNAPYRPAWLGRLRIVRAGVRLLPYLRELAACTRDVDLVHVMANSGWAWHLFAMPAIGIARLRGVPAVVNYRGGEAASFLARQSRVVTPVLRQAAAVVVPSGFLAEIFDRHGVATEIVPNVIDLERFQPATTRTRGQHLVVTRNLEDLYDIPTALRAFARVRAVYPDARLTVAGSGPRLSALRELATALDIRAQVTFAGQLDHARIAELYRAADLALNPSTVDNFPNSVLEALASGVPVVSTNVGGVPHLMQDGVNGLLVPPRDPDAMARAALRVLADSQLATLLADAGLRTVAEYTWPRVRSRLLGVYARALKLPASRLAAGGS